MIEATRHAGSRRYEMRSVSGIGPVTGTKISRWLGMAPGGRCARRPVSRTCDSSSTKGVPEARLQGQHRHRLDADGTDDDVGAGVVAHRDLQRRQALLHEPSLAFQVRPAAVQGGSQVAATDEAADLLERHPELAQGEDAPQLRQLGRRVVAIPARWVDPDGAEQRELVVGTQLLGADAAEA